MLFARPMPGMVPGRSSTLRGFTGPGSPARRRRNILARLVGGFFLLLSAQALADVRLEWRPSAPIADRDEVATYVLEREAAGAWREVARVRHSAEDPAFDVARSAFVVTDPAGEADTRYRLTAVDALGNVSAPVSVRPGCSWLGVPVVCEACRCSAVTAVLDEARGDLVGRRLAEPGPFDAAVRRLAAITVMAPEHLVLEGRRVAGVYGIDAQGRRLLYLTPDLGAALHELWHAYEGDVDVGGKPTDHPTWDRDGRLRELDLRFQSRHRRAP